MENFSSEELGYIWQAEPKVFSVKEHGTTCNFFMDIIGRSPPAQHSLAMELSSLYKLNAVDRRDTPRDVFCTGHGPVALRSA